MPHKAISLPCWQTIGHMCILFVNVANKGDLWRLLILAVSLIRRNRFLLICIKVNKSANYKGITNQKCLLYPHLWRSRHHCVTKTVTKQNKPLIISGLLWSIGESNSWPFECHSHAQLPLSAFRGRFWPLFSFLPWNILGTKSKNVFQYKNSQFEKINKIKPHLNTAIFAKLFGWDSHWSRIYSFIKILRNERFDGDHERIWALPRLS